MCNTISTGTIGSPTIGADTICETGNTTGIHMSGTDTLGKTADTTCQTADTTGPDSIGPDPISSATPAQPEAEAGPSTR